MREEIRVCRAVLYKKGAVVRGAEAQSELEARGYGEKEGKSLRLMDYETLYLHHTGRLIVTRRGRTISFEELLDFALKRDPNAWTRFLIYRDLRSRGYVAKEGFGFGVDFRVYERGEYGSKPAKLVVFGLNEGTEKSVEELRESVEQIRRMGKEAIIAVIERRGEVIYYRVNRWRPLPPQ